MNLVAFEVPGRAVGVNDSFTGGDRPFSKTPEARAYARAVGEHGALARRLAGVKPMEGDVEVTLTFFHDSRRPDVDGGIKATLDAMQVPDEAHPTRAGLYLNDRQVADLVVRRRLDPERPRVEIVVRELAPAQALHAALTTTTDMARLRPAARLRSSVRRP